MWLNLLLTAQLRKYWSLNPFAFTLFTLLSFGNKVFISVEPLIIPKYPERTSILETDCKLGSTKYRIIFDLLEIRMELLRVVNLKHEYHAVKTFAWIQPPYVGKIPLTLQWNNFEEEDTTMKKTVNNENWLCIGII